MESLYLDYNATAPMAPEVRAALLPWLDPIAANPSSAHAAGQRARAAVERARAQVAALVGDGFRTVFTSGGTEADNLAIHGLLGWPPAGHLVVSAVEHPAVLEPAAALEGAGVEITRVAVDRDGRLEPAAVAAAMRPDTRLVSVMAANNEVGTLQPVAEIAEAAAQRGVPLHCDAVQAAAWLDLRAATAGASLVSLSGHKIGGPPGIGALLVADGVALEPTLRGGGQQLGARPGTEPTTLIVGMGAACERVRRRAADEAIRVGELSAGLLQRLQEAIPGCHPTVSGAPRLPNTLHLCVEGCRGDVLVARLDLEGVAASAGSACASGVHERSYVLEAMGVPAELEHGALRLSLGYETREEQIEALVPRLQRCVAAVRSSLAGARP